MKGSYFMVRRRPLTFAALALTAGLAACNGGGNSTSAIPGSFTTSSPGTIPTNGAATPTPTPGPVNVNGVVVSIPVGTFGSATVQTPLSGAIVIVGPKLVAGATPPAGAPAGDVMLTTDSNGVYRGTIASGPAAPDTAQASYVFPVNNRSGATLPSNGYYVSVFAPGSDGKSAGAPFPVHAFSGVTNGALATQRVSVASADEAGFLALLNHDRTTANALALPLIFDETAMEAARLHVNEEAQGNFYCHYDAQNRGPSSRYLGLLAIGQDDENIGKTSGQDPTGSYTFVEAQFMAEASNTDPSQRGHYANIVDATHAWAGLAVLFFGTTAQYVSQELVSPQNTAPYTYPVVFSSSSCPAGTYADNS